MLRDDAIFMMPGILNSDEAVLICPLQSGSNLILEWTRKMERNGKKHTPEDVGEKLREAKVTP
jgi:tRNA A37 methylthiotransferase MiaB